MFNLKQCIGSQGSQQKRKLNSKVKFQDSSLTQAIRDKSPSYNQTNPKKDVLVQKASFKQGLLLAPKLPQKKNEHAAKKDQGKEPKDMIKQAFQRSCMSFANQASLDYAQEGETNPEPPAQRQQPLKNTFSGGLLGQFIKPYAKKPVEVISLSSNSSKSSKINFTNNNPQSDRQQPRPPFPQKKDPFSIPPLNLTERTPLASPPHTSEAKPKLKTGLRYQLPDRTFKQKFIVKENKTIPRRQEITTSDGRNQTVPKPLPSLNSIQEQQSSNPKENRTIPELKFSNSTPSVQYKPHAHLPFPNTEFYVHIDLLPQEQIDLRVLQQQDGKTMGDRNLGQRNDRPFSPLPLPSKYKISNSHHKYKQERIDNYFNTDQRREQFSRKAGNEKEDDIFPLDPSRMARRSWKYPKVHHPLAIQGEMPLKSLRCDEFLERRARKKGEPRDLGVLSLDEVVQQCFSKSILSQEVYVEYVKRSTPEMAIKFAQLFLDGKTEEWDYEHLKITLIDHRRLAEVLAKSFPKEYVIYHPHALQKDVHDFLSNLYLLTANDYYALLNSLDDASGVDFWSSFKIRFQECLDKPLMIFPYQPKLGAEKPKIKWSDSNGPNSRYTSTEKKLMHNYRATREKLKEGCQKEKQGAYIDCEEELQSSFSSSELSSEPSEAYTPSKAYPAGRNNAKKSGKGRTRQSK